MGVCTLSSSSLLIPLAASWSFTIATRLLLPIMPAYACVFPRIFSRHSVSYRCPLVTMTNQESESPLIPASPFSNGSQITVSAPAALALSANFGRSSRTVTANPSIFPIRMIGIDTCPPPQMMSRGIRPILSRKTWLFPLSPAGTAVSSAPPGALSPSALQIRYFSPACSPLSTVSAQISPSALFSASDSRI